MTRFTRGEPVHYMAAFCLDSAHPEMPKRALRYLAINSECMSAGYWRDFIDAGLVRPTRAVPLVSPGSQRIVCPMCGDAILSAVPMHRIRRQQVDHAPLDQDVPNDEQPRVPVCRAGVPAGRKSLAIGDGGSGRGVHTRAAQKVRVPGLVNIYPIESDDLYLSRPWQTQGPK